MKFAAGVLLAFVLLVAAGCGYDTSATFNADGSVTVGLELLFPNDLLRGANGATISGFTSSDLAAAGERLKAKFPGATVVPVSAGNESGALVTIPFKTEKDAFDFLTSPPQLSPDGATSGSGVSLNLSNTGGLFTYASHTSAGGVDTYTFVTAPQAITSPSPGTPQVISGSEIASVFSITFSLTLTHAIASAPGATFALDRKTATWKLDWTRSETLTATTAPDPRPVAVVKPATDTRLAVVAGVIALAIGIVVGMVMPRRRWNRDATPAARPPES